MGPTINTSPIRIDVDYKSVKIAVLHTHSRLSALLNYRHNRMREQCIAPFSGVIFCDGEGRTNHPLSMSLDDNDFSLCLSVQIESPVSASRICGFMQQTMKSLADQPAKIKKNS